MSHKVDIVLMVLFPVVAAVTTLVLRTNFLISTLLFFGVPAFYLSARKPEIVSKSLIFAAIFSIPLGIVVDSLAVLDKSWHIPTTLFSFRLLGLVPVEDLIWLFLLVFFGIMFYEYFLDLGKKKDRISKNIKYLIGFLISLLVVFLIFFFINSALLHIKYFYLKMGIILALLPPVTFLSFFPSLLSKFVKTSVYFFGLLLLHELVALQTGQWIFPGQNFIGFVKLLGLRFPFEEFLFFIVLATAAGLSYYEFFVDDRR